MFMTVTNVGISRATVASQLGYKIRIDKFKLYGGGPVLYSPDPTFTVPNGNLAHQGAISSAFEIGLGEVEFKISLPHTLGNFNFHSVGLYLDDGTLFALGNLGFRQDKTKSANGIVGNILDFSCIVKLSASLNHVINLYLSHPLSNMVLPEIPLLSMLEPPTDEMNAVIVREVDYAGESFVAYRKADKTWSFTNFKTSYTVTVTAIAGSTITFSPVLPEYYANGSAKQHIASVVSGPASGRARFITGSNASRTIHVLDSSIPGLTVGSIVEVKASTNILASTFSDLFYEKTGGVISGDVIVDPPTGFASIKLGSSIELTTDNTGSLIVKKNGVSVMAL